MSNVSLKKPFKHFATNALFNAAKVSVNAENTAYIQNGEIHTGTPDILWEHTVFIHDVAQIWNRGRFYNSQKYLGKLAAISKNAFMEYSGMPIVTFVDVKPETLYNNVSLFQSYPGILPSIVVAPGIVQDINKVLGLANKGCDILSTAFNGVSVYEAGQDKDYNYDNFLDDMTAVEQWLTEHGLFTNCYKYPNAAVAATESEFIQRYEEYGLVQANTAANGLTQDNMLLNGKLVNSNAGVTEAISEINSTTGTVWLIYLIDTTNITSLDTLIEAVQQGIDDGHCIYMQMHEGLQMRASEFNIGRSENTLPFRVYKDGSVDANLTASSVEAITETVAAEIAQTLPGEGLSYNTTTGKLDWDSSVLDNYVQKETGKGLSTNDFSDAYMSKLDGIASGAEVNVQSDWSESDAASDAYIKNKPEIPSIDGLATVAYVTTEDAKKVDKVDGKGLSTNDFTTTYMNKLNGIAAGAEVNVQADWSVTDSSSDAYIKNKPEIPTVPVTSVAGRTGDVVLSKTDVGLDNVDNVQQIPLTYKGANGGVAELDANGLVPASQLPSFVDDILEGYLYNGKFYEDSAHTKEIAGETGKIYVNIDNDKTYRWSGTKFTVISETLALGETSSTAWPGDRGKATETGLANHVSNSDIHVTAADKTAWNNKVDKVEGKGLSTNDFTTTYMNKLNGIAAGAEVNVQADWNVTDSSSDSYIKNKPEIPSIDGLATVAYVTAEDAKKVDKVDGKGLSTNDFTTTYMNKLNGIAAGAEVNVQADWNVTDSSSDAYINNKPDIPSIDGLATVAYVTAEDAKKVDKVDGKGLSTNDFTTTYMNKLNGIAAGAEVNVQADWNVTNSSSDAYIKNKPGIDTVVTSGSSKLITSGATYTALAETERTVATALAEFKTTYLDTLDSPERMQKFMYYMAANLLSYWNANGISFILQG